MATTPLPRLTRRAALVALGGIAAAFGCKTTPYREVELDLSSTESGRVPDEPRASVFRFSVAAMQSPHNTYTSYSDLFARLGQVLGIKVEFVQRRTYGEVNDLLLDGYLDAAYVCTGAYLKLRRRAPGRIEILAVPVIAGKTTYESLIIVPANSSARSLCDLGGKRFAFTDELSFSGHRYPAHLLRGMNGDPADFFETVTYTHSHDRSIDAVVRGAVDGAAVDGLIYEDLATRDASVRARTRIIHRSPPFGIMPIVAAPHLAAALRARVREALLGLHEDPEAAAALRAIHIERFAVPAPDLYDGADAMMPAE